MARTRAQMSDPNCEVTDSDYDAILSAIMESSRGRWFLAEYARLNRHADTDVLLTEINRVKEKLDLIRAARPYLVETTFSEAYPKHPSHPQPPIENSNSVARRHDKRAAAASPETNSSANPSDTNSSQRPSSSAADAFDFRLLKGLYA